MSDKSGKKLKPKGGGARARPNANANIFSSTVSSTPSQSALPTPPTTQAESETAERPPATTEAQEPPTKRRRVDENVSGRESSRQASDEAQILADAAVVDGLKNQTLSTEADGEVRTQNDEHEEINQQDPTKMPVLEEPASTSREAAGSEPATSTPQADDIVPLDRDPGTERHIASEPAHQRPIQQHSGSANEVAGPSMPQRPSTPRSRRSKSRERSPAVSTNQHEVEVESGREYGLGNDRGSDETNPVPVAHSGAANRKRNASRPLRRPRQQESDQQNATTDPIDATHESRTDADLASQAATAVMVAPTEGPSAQPTDAHEQDLDADERVSSEQPAAKKTRKTRSVEKPAPSVEVGAAKRGRKSGKNKIHPGPQEQDSLAVGPDQVDEDGIDVAENREGAATSAHPTVRRAKVRTKAGSSRRSKTRIGSTTADDNADEDAAENDNRRRDAESPMFEAETDVAPSSTRRQKPRGAASGVEESFVEGDASARQRKPKRKKRKPLNVALEDESDPEKHEINESQVTMTQLTRDTGKGVMGRIEKKMLDIDWDEVKRKRQEAEEREYEEAERERREQEIDARLDRAGEQAADDQSAPRTKIVNGEIIVDTDSLAIDRHAATIAQAEGAVVEENEEDDITKKVNQHSHIHDNRRDPEERRIMKMKSDPWNAEETDRFFHALGMFGTDFYIISTMFPGKTRRQIKLKFIREERKDMAYINRVLLGLTEENHEMDLAKYAEATGRDESDYKNPQQIEQELREAESKQKEDIERQKQVAVEAQREKQRKAAEKQEAAKRERAAKRAAKKAKRNQPEGNAAAYHDGTEEIVAAGDDGAS